MSGAAEVLGWSLLHSIWQGALLAAGLWVVLRVAPPSAVRIRYAVSALALASIFLLPALNYRHTMALWSDHRSWVLETADGILRTELAERGRAEVGALRSELRRRQATEWPAAGPAAAAQSLAGRDAVRAFGALWIAAVLLLLLRLGREQRRALRLAEGGMPDDAWRRAAAGVAARLGIDRPVRVRITDRVDVPALVGWRWPVVLIPRSAAALSGGARDAVLAHELAHVARADYLANLLQSVAEALLFYSPAAWWIASRIREERECCCDRAAVGAAPGGPAGYAHALLALETGRAATRMAVALNGGSLLRRIRRIHALARERRHPERVSAAAGAALLLALGLGLCVATLTPGIAARRSAGALMAGDIENVRLIVVGAPGAPVPAGIAPSSCPSLVLGKTV